MLLTQKSTVSHAVSAASAPRADMAEAHPALNASVWDKQCQQMCLVLGFSVVTWTTVLLFLHLHEN